jgi:hypothetical protein
VTDAAHLAAALARRYADDADARKLAELLQPVEPGQRRPETRARRGERDALIVEAVLTHYGDMTTSAAAKAMCTDWNRYAASSWPRERDLPECPARLIGTVRECFWRLLKIEDRALGWSRIAQLIEIARSDFQRARGIR